MSEFQTVAKVGDIPQGEGRSFPVNGKMVGVFRVEDEYFAINDICPHMGASLSTGYLEEGRVMCPWHAWRFDVRDGTWCDNPKVKTDCYDLRIEAGEIQVSVPDVPRPAPPADSASDTSTEETPG